MYIASFIQCIGFLEHYLRDTGMKSYLKSLAKQHFVLFNLWELLAKWIRCSVQDKKNAGVRLLVLLMCRSDRQVSYFTLPWSTQL